VLFAAVPIHLERNVKLVRAHARRNIVTLTLRKADELDESEKIGLHIAIFIENAIEHW
jgi:hypothetical protein